MKTKHFFLRTLMAMFVMVGTLPLLTGCEEDVTGGGDNNDQPSGTMTMGDQTQDVTAAYIYSGVNDDGTTFQCIWLQGPYASVYFGVRGEADGTYDIETPANVLDHASLPADGKAYCLINGNEVGTIIVSSGSLSVSKTKSGTTYTITTTGTTENNVTVQAQYTGTLSVSNTNPFEDLDDPDDPDDPAGNYVQHQGDTTSIVSLVYSNLAGYHEYILMDNDQQPVLVFASLVELTSGTYQISADDENAQIRCGYVDDEETTAVAGVLTLSLSGDNCTLSFSGSNVSAYYQGTLTDMSSSGSGTMTLGDQTLDIQGGIKTSVEGIEIIAFTANANGTMVATTFGTLGTFTSGTYSLFDVNTDPSGFLNPSAAFCSISVGDDQIGVVSGTLTINIEGDTYTVNATGNTDSSTTVSLSYTGTLTAAPLTKAAF